MEGQPFDEVDSFFFIDVNRLFLLLVDKEDTVLLITWCFLVELFGNVLEYGQLPSLMTLYMRMVYHFVCHYLISFFITCLSLCMPYTFQSFVSKQQLHFVFISYILVSMLLDQFPYIFAHILSVLLNLV